MHTVLEQSSNVAGLAGKGERKVAKEDNIRGDSRKSTVRVWGVQEPGFMEIKIDCGRDTGGQSLETK